MTNPAQGTLLLAGLLALTSKLKTRGSPAKTDGDNLIWLSEYYGLDLDEEQRKAVKDLFEYAGIGQHLGGDVLVLVARGDKVVGALTEYNGDEWSVAVDSGYQGQGIATRMVKLAIEDGNSGFMVAGSEDGAGWLHSLFWKLSAEERESLDVPSWTAIEEDAKRGGWEQG